MMRQASQPTDRRRNDDLHETALSLGAAKSAGHSIVAASAVAIEATGLAALGSAFTGDMGDSFDRAIEMLLTRSGRAILTGIGKSGHIAHKIAATFASTGTPAYFVHPAEASHGDLGMIHADDTVIALSWSGESVELAPLISYTRRFNVGLIAITHGHASALGGVADVCLTLPKVEEACPNGLAPTTSTLIQLAMGDALAVALLRARNFSPTDFAIYHPGGKLGAQLMRVSDVMRSLDLIGCVPENAKMAEATLAMSHWSTGFVLVTHGRHLIGIITDGDLRRHMTPDLMGRSVADVMTRKPKTVGPNTLTGEALRFLNERNIAVAPVVDGDTLVGAIHINDLVRAGIV